MTLDLGLAARLIAGIRTETARHSGCREWDTPGIAKALQATEGPPGAVLAAAALAAEDANLRAPSAAAFKAHWPVQASAPPKASHDIPCPEHIGERMPCRRCTEGTRPPRPEELAAMRQTAKEAAEYHREMQRLAEERKAAKG